MKMLKRYDCKVMIKSIELSAKNKIEARKEAINSLKENLNSKWFFEVEEVKENKRRWWNLWKATNQYP